MLKKCRSQETMERQAAADKLLETQEKPCRGGRGMGKYTDGDRGPWDLYRKELNMIIHINLVP